MVNAEAIGGWAGAAAADVSAKEEPRRVTDHALARLPPGYRAVFVLHDVEGYEHEDVGRLLDCAAGTSKSQLHKARAPLRRLLQK